MRMTIYLLDGCSADYVIIKNNFHPVPLHWSNFKRISALDFRKTHTLAGPCEMQFQVVGFMGSSWGKEGEGLGYDKTFLQNIV